MKTHGEILHIPTDRIRPFPGQPREYFDKDELTSLEASIRQRGQIQSGLVRELHDDSGFDFELVDGQRRWTACCRLGVPFRAELIEPADENEQFEISLTANFQSSGHTPMEISKACARLYAAGRSEAYIGNLFGKTQSWVGRKIQLIRLIPELQEMLDPAMVPNSSDRLPVTLAEDLARLDPEEQRQKYRKIQKDGLVSIDKARIREDLKDSGEILSRKQAPANHARFVDSFFSRFIEEIRKLERRLTETVGLMDALARSGKLAEIAEKVQRSQVALDALSVLIAEGISRKRQSTVSMLRAHNKSAQGGAAYGARK